MIINVRFKKLTPYHTPPFNKNKNKRLECIQYSELLSLRRNCRHKVQTKKRINISFLWTYKKFRDSNISVKIFK